MLAKIVTWAAIAVAVIWIVSDPVKSGTDVHGWIQSGMTFLSNLASG